LEKAQRARLFGALAAALGHAVLLEVILLTLTTEQQEVLTAGVEEVVELIVIMVLVGAAQSVQFVSFGPVVLDNSHLLAWDRHELVY
jgi:hypothetical protein